MNNNYKYSSFFDEGSGSLHMPNHDSQHVMANDNAHANGAGAARANANANSEMYRDDGRRNGLSNNSTVNSESLTTLSVGGSVTSLPGATEVISQPAHNLSGHSPIVIPRPRSRSVSYNTKRDANGHNGAVNNRHTVAIPPSSESNDYLPQIPSFRSFDDTGSRSHEGMLLVDTFNASDTSLTMDTSSITNANGRDQSPNVERSRYRRPASNTNGRRAVHSHNSSKTNLASEINGQQATDQNVQAGNNEGYTIESVIPPLRNLNVNSETVNSKLEELDFIANSGDSEKLISFIPNQRRNIVAKRGSVFTLMVAGESGLGKSTLINTLFCDRFEEPSKDPRQTLDANSPKTTRIEVREAIYIENGFPVKFTVIDTPGFGDFTNNTHCWIPIINYIDNQHKLYMLQEEQPDRRKKVDTRVHACLYFIRPSGKGLLPLDIKAMQELSTRVNLIPVLAKADSFTLKDREYFKQQVRDTISASGIEIYCPQDVNPDLDEDIRQMPYAVIASEVIVGSDAYGRPIHARPYRWGVAEVENEDHCDFVKLRRVLMERYMLDLVDSTIEKHYQHYRKACMVRRIEHARGELLDSGGPDVAKQVDLEGGLQTLSHISRFGKDFLEDGQLENDPIFRERQRKINDKFAVIVAFHEDRFESWRNELRKKQDELNQDIENASKALDTLQNAIDILESQREFEPERIEARESRGGFGKARYGMRNNS